VPRETIDYVVLDALADDLESVETILRRTNHEEFGWRRLQDGRSFTRDEVVAALLRLIRDDLVEACAHSEADSALVGIGSRALPSGNLDEFWFVITPHGRMTHSSWEPSSGLPE